MDTQQIMTRDGWVDLGDVCLDEGDTQCIDCDQLATEETPIGGGNYWAQCSGCAHESHCESMEASRRSEYEMDYYAGYE